MFKKLNIISFHVTVFNIFLIDYKARLKFYFIFFELLINEWIVFNTRQHQIQTTSRCALIDFD